MTGTFVLSLDTELAWGTMDKDGLDARAIVATALGAFGRAAEKAPARA